MILIAYFPQSGKDSIKAFAEMPVHQGREDFGQSGVVKRLDWDDVEMASETSSDGVPATAGGSHPTNKQLQINQYIEVVSLHNYTTFKVYPIVLIVWYVG